jgi:hypothetical protein
MTADAPAGCAHAERIDGVCVACGHCQHEIILNGACYFCGSTDLDPVAASPKPAAAFVPADRLVRKRDRDDP